MTKEYPIPSDLIKPFKILCYQILAYGEDEGRMDVYIDSDGSNDIGYTLLKSGSRDSHVINTGEKIDNFFQEICDDLIEEYLNRYEDKGGRIIFDVNAEQKKLVINVYEFFSKEYDEGAHYTYDEILARFDEYDEIIDRLKNLGKFIKLYYSGSGDSGWIDGEYVGDNGTEGFTHPLDNSFEEMLYSLLSSNFGSWGDNDGSKGHFIINTETKDIEIYHTSFEEDAKFYESVRTYDLTKSE
jgi:hypothetical protein